MFSGVIENYGRDRTKTFKVRKNNPFLHQLRNIVPKMWRTTSFFSVFFSLLKLLVKSLLPIYSIFFKYLCSLSEGKKAGKYWERGK